jgi:hypothetical protein
MSRRLLRVFGNTRPFNLSSIHVAHLQACPSLAQPFFGSPEGCLLSFWIDFLSTIVVHSWVLLLSGSFLYLKLLSTCSILHGTVYLPYQSAFQALGCYTTFHPFIPHYITYVLLPGTMQPVILRLHILCDAPFLLLTLCFPFYCWAWHNLLLFIPCIWVLYNYLALCSPACFSMVTILVFSYRWVQRCDKVADLLCWAADGLAIGGAVAIFVGEPLAAPSDLRPRACAFPLWNCLVPFPILTTPAIYLACPWRTWRTRWHHMTEACETSCKQVARDTRPFSAVPYLSYPLPHHSPRLLSASRLSSHFLSHPPTPLFVVVGVEEILWVSHWLPHRTFAQGPVHSLYGIALSLSPS